MPPPLPKSSTLVAWLNCIDNSMYGCGIFIEIKLGKMKWLLVGGYNPLKAKISYFLNHVSQQLDRFFSTYENFLILGDLNSTVFETDM